MNRKPSLCYYSNPLGLTLIEQRLLISKYKLVIRDENKNNVRFKSTLQNFKVCSNTNIIARTSSTSQTVVHFKKLWSPSKDSSIDSRIALQSITSPHINITTRNQCPSIILTMQPYTVGCELRNFMNSLKIIRITGRNMILKVDSINGKSRMWNHPIVNRFKLRILKMMMMSSKCLLGNGCNSRKKIYNSWLKDGLGRNNQIIKVNVI